ncbi:hypothetical protein [Mesorhizobium sp.]|uniref:hypothetical protein n=1 Tax=Mesorhizobium sp. TaxID=1871066 RepID=UPI000FE84458|nr:hypothetical protein [Mesorhizobium sp.]RWP42377.1 MAG: hypothetical protein EOR05_29555 [Mesorhizobium sp.]
MAFSDPKVYFDLLLVPMLARFKGDPSAYDLAFSTCVMIDNFGDLLAVERNISPKTAREELAGECSDFRKVGAVANAFKHVEIIRWDPGRTCGDRLGAAFDDGSYFDDGTTWDDSDERVVIDFPDLCETVTDFLRRRF